MASSEILVDQIPVCVGNLFFFIDRDGIDHIIIPIKDDKNKFISLHSNSEFYEVGDIINLDKEELQRIQPFRGSILIKQ